MLLMRQSSVLCFLTLTTLAGSISNDCTERFEFPNLNDSQRIISYSNENISVEFMVNSSCSTPFTGAYNVFDNTMLFCTFHYQNGNCFNNIPTEYCRCPEEGSGLHWIDIPADNVSNTTWTWSSKPSGAKEHKIRIVIRDGTAPDRTDGSTSITPATNNVHMQISTLENIDTQDSNETDSNTTGAIVATCITIITAVIVTIALLVVKKYKIKVTLRRRLAPQHDLALQEIQERNQQQPDSTPAQPQQQQQQRRLPEIPGQYQVPCSVPARSGLDASRSVGRVSHVYEVVGGDEEGEVPEVLKTELPDTNLHPRPPAQEMTAAQASKPGIGNGLYFHIHPNE